MYLKLFKGSQNGGPYASKIALGWAINGPTGRKSGTAQNARQKWNYPRRNLAVGDVVLVVDQTSARNAWPIRRIMKVFPDKEGFVRRVQVKTKIAVLERPINNKLETEFIEVFKDVKGYYERDIS